MAEVDRNPVRRVCRTEAETDAQAKTGSISTVRSWLAMSLPPPASYRPLESCGTTLPDHPVLPQS